MKYLLTPAAILATVAIVFSTVSPAAACICITTPTTEERVERSDAIVVGQITAVTNRTATVSIERFLKGFGESPLIVTNPPECGTQLSPNQRYLFFLFLRPPSFGRGAHFETNICMGNVRLAGGRIGEDIAARRIAEVEDITGPGQPPDGSGQLAAPPEDDDLPREAFWALAIVLPIAFLAAATLSPSRRR